MEKNEIKKALYREKPIASLIHLFEGVKCYKTYLENGTAVAFEVPSEEAVGFSSEMNAQLLIRWMV